MKIEDLVYKRNRYMAIVMWVTPFILSEKVIVILMGLILASIAEIASRNKKRPVISMYIILTLSNIYLAFNLYHSKEVTNWFYVFVFFSMSVLYLKKTAIVLNFIYSIIITSYFWFRPEGVRFEFTGTILGFSNFLMVFGVSSYLFITAVNLNQKLKKDSDYERLQAKKERKKTKKTLKNMKETASILSDFSKGIREQVVETSATAEQTAVLFKDMNQRFSEEIDGVHTVHNMFRDVDTQIQKVYESSKELSILAKQNDELSYVGQNQLKSVENETENIEKRNVLLLKTLEALESQGEMMLNIIDFIIDLSKKTNLLSINARIEAARAGEFGKGFAVVADEIGKMAAETKQSANKIGEIIHQFKNTAEEATEESRQNVQTIDQHKKIIDSTKKTFQQVIHNTSLTREHSNHIYMFLNQINELSDEVLHQMNKIASHSENNLNEVNTLSQIVSKQIHQISQIHQEFSELEEKVNLLNQNSEEAK